MEIATYIGISIRDFWDITPKELDIAVRSFNKRQQDEADLYLQKYENQKDLMTYQAFLISRWVWEKKVDINQYIGTSKEDKKTEMTDEMMLNQVKILNAMLGGEFIELGKEDMDGI